MRKINILKYKGNDEVLDYTATFHQFIRDEEGFIVAIVERSDGTITTEALHSLQFIV